jgi:hypothetical protein
LYACGQRFEVVKEFIYLFIRVEAKMYGRMLYAWGQRFEVVKEFIYLFIRVEAKMFGRIE